MAEFPANKWLGYTLNLCRSVPTATHMISTSVRTVYHILEFDVHNTRPVTMDGKAYAVPKDISVSQNLLGGETFVTFPSGQHAINKLKTDHTLLQRLYPVVGKDDSVPQAIFKYLPSDLQYAFYSFREPKYIAMIENHKDVLNEAVLLKALRDLPPSFVGENPEVVDKYEDFFSLYGSHVVTGAEYGSWFQMHIWGSNDNSEVKAAWAEDVKADYDGIPSAGHYDSNIKLTSQYKDYQMIRSSMFSILGGDIELAADLLNHRDYKSFEAWQATANRPSTRPVSFSLTEMWTLVSLSDNVELARFALPLYKAYEWITAHRSK
ncbi:hypothetical protein PQX77_016912 [Marasmius sp. AFHP31]|nr:hypothetical protein PQX77_016912 [Marasmius sp. AFHP31]